MISSYIEQKREMLVKRWHRTLLHNGSGFWLVIYFLHVCFSEFIWAQNQPCPIGLHIKSQPRLCLYTNCKNWHWQFLLHFTNFLHMYYLTYFTQQHINRILLSLYYGWGNWGSETWSGSKIEPGSKPRFFVLSPEDIIYIYMTLHSESKLYAAILYCHQISNKS